MDQFIQAANTNIHHATNLLVASAQFATAAKLSFVEIALQVLELLERLSCGVKYQQYFSEEHYAGYINGLCFKVQQSIVSLTWRFPAAEDFDGYEDAMVACNVEHVHVVVAGGATISWLVDALGARPTPWGATPVFAVDKEPAHLVYDPMLAPFCRRRRPIEFNLDDLPEVSARAHPVPIGKWGPPGELPVYLHEVDFSQLLRRASHKGVQLSQWLVDLGALDVENSPLGELIRNGMSAVLVEGDIFASGEGSRLIHFFKNRPDVCIVNYFMAPEQLPLAIKTCTDSWQPFWRLDGTPVSDATLGPDVLKIDVDNGGCDFLLAAFESGLRPLIVQMELREMYPPPLFFWQRFGRESACPYNERCGGFCQVSQDCSLGAAMSILRDYELYPVMQGHDFIFLRADVAAAVIPSHMRPDPTEFAQEL